MLSDNNFLKIAKDELNIQEKLGQGAQGAVYKAYWKTKQQIVAVKHVFEFDPELSVLQNIRHKNIVTFIGAVDEDHFKAIVLEYAEYGSLYQFISTNDISFEQLLIWARHIAMGLNYLHNEAPQKIIHRDLKSRNVVIASNRIAKMCDFGSSRSLEQSTRFSRLHGTVAWMAPEIIRNSKVSEKCDTYSFGVLLWELITGKTPFQDEEDHALIFAVCQHKRRPPIPESCPEKFSKLIRDCWGDDPAKRPGVPDILLRLNAMLGDMSLTEDVNLFLEDKVNWVATLEAEIQEMKVKYQNVEETLRIQLQEKDHEIQKMRSGTRQKPEDGLAGSWTELDVVQWLHYELNDPDYDYSKEFLDNHITGNRLLELREDDLTKLGVSSLGHKKDIMKAIWHLQQQLLHVTNYPPLISPTSKHEKVVNKTGTLFTLDVTFGNNFIRPGWNMFMFVEGDEIAQKSVKCVEFKVGPGDVVKLNRAPYVLDHIRYDEPKDVVKCTVHFRGHIIRPKYWCETFQVVLALGGYQETAQINIYLNEDQSPSNVPSIASSYSSFSSFNVIDCWKTAPGPPQGAWSKGPPPNLRSPVGTYSAWNTRRESYGLVSSSGGNSPILSPKSKNKSYVNLNHSRSSPAKMNQMVNSHSRNKPTKLSLPSLSARPTGEVSDLTPTHDPDNPRFTSARYNELNNGARVNFNTQGSEVETSAAFTFGSMQSDDINANFSSTHNTATDQSDGLSWLSEQQEVTPKRTRGVSISSTLTSNSGSLNDLNFKFDGMSTDQENYTPKTEPKAKPTLFSHISSGPLSYAQILNTPTKQPQIPKPDQETQEPKLSKEAAEKDFFSRPKTLTRSRTSSGSSDKRGGGRGRVRGRGRGRGGNRYNNRYGK